MASALIEKAIEIAGSQTKLAEACGVKQQSIWQAKDAGRVSAELALLIERAVAGKVTARELRPDLPWPSPPAHEQGDDHRPVHEVSL